jgi:PiT family inorganic phosphate transporter
MDFKSMHALEQATTFNRHEFVRIGLALIFLVMTTIYVGITYKSVPNNFLLSAAAVIGAYMAMNIGANDVANNVGPAVGSKTLTLAGAIIIAVIFESAGAIVAGGDVVSTIKKGIIDPQLVADASQFTWLMMAALLAGALWLNLATYYGMPVSTTHSIVGGVLGAGIAAGGIGVANWDRMAAIAASWVISPVMGGIIAAFFLYVIKRKITYQTDIIASAKRIVPILIGAMAWVFTAYIMLKGVKKIWNVDILTAGGIGLAVAIMTLFLTRQWVARTADNLPQGKAGLNKLFVLPLICAAALLSFAHGANDVANAIGPLAAISDTVIKGMVSTKAAIPLWVLVIGALGISLGLALYGPKLIRTVGSEITELDQTRAFCIAMAAAITVIIATQLGLPVSSTHTALGAVFGVGFLREALKANYARVVDEIREHHHDAPHGALDSFLETFEAASFNEKGVMLREMKHKAARPVDQQERPLTKAERKDLRRVYRKELVKRSAVMKIISAWLVTVPISAFLGAILYYTFRGMLLP